MPTRRIAIGILLASLIAGCNVVEPVDTMDAGEVRVTTIAVGFTDAERMQASLDALEDGVTTSRFAEDLRASISRQVIPATQRGSRPVSLSVAVDSLTLGSTVPGLIRPIFVPSFSQIVAIVTVADARTGEVLLRRGFVGDDNPGGVTFGAVARAEFSGGKSKARAYRETVSGFAEDLARELFQPAPQAGGA